MSARLIAAPLISRIRHWIAGKAPVPSANTSPTGWPTPDPERTLLFVDFDGVHRAENGSFEFLPNLLRILRLRPEVDVVMAIRSNS